MRSDLRLSDSCKVILVISLTILDYSTHTSWSFGGHTSGHFRPLPAYAVTSLSMVEANKMKYANSSICNGSNSNNMLNSQIIDTMMRIYNYHWSVIE